MRTCVSEYGCWGYRILQPHFISRCGRVVLQYPLHFRNFALMCSRLPNSHCPKTRRTPFWSYQLFSARNWLPVIAYSSNRETPNRWPPISLSCNLRGNVPLPLLLTFYKRQYFVVSVSFDLPLSLFLSFYKFLYPVAPAFFFYILPTPLLFLPLVFMASFPLSSQNYPPVIAYSSTWATPTRWATLRFPRVLFR